MTEDKSETPSEQAAPESRSEINERTVAELQQALLKVSNELDREKARKELWCGIAVALREAGCSMTPVLWHSKITERVRELFHDSCEFEEEVTRRMKGQFGDILLK